MATEQNDPLQEASPYNEETTQQAAASGSAIVAGTVEVNAIHEQDKGDQTETKTGSIKLLDSMYEDFRYGEREEALPDDPIKVKIKPESSEFKTLQDAGLSPEQIARGVFTRRELLDAGYRFINTLGSGEKGIISGVVDDPERGEKLDFTDRTLLTQAELELVYRHQQAHPEIYGLQGEDIDEVRKDMLSFALEATAQPAFINEVDFRTQIFHDLDYGGLRVGEPKDWKIVKAYLDKQVKNLSKVNKNLNQYGLLSTVQTEFVQNHCNDIFQEEVDDGGPFLTKQIRGYHTASLSIRAQKLDGQASPFLESGFYFGGNLDVNVFTGPVADMRSKDQLRLNIATIHLAGAHPDFPGFSEMGGDSADQQYMPTGYYVENIYPHDPDERQRVQENEHAAFDGISKGKIIAKAQQRLIDVAKAEMVTLKKSRWYRRQQA